MGKVLKDKTIITITICFTLLVYLFRNEDIKPLLKILKNINKDD